MVRRLRKKTTHKGTQTAPRRYYKRSSLQPQQLSVTNTRNINDPFNSRFRSVLPYYELFNITANGSGVAAHYFFSANSLFDPNRTGGGHQPLKFDQIMAMYDKYHVTGAKIIVKALNLSSTEPVIVGVRLLNDNTSTSSVAEIIENGKGKHCILAPAGQDGSTATLVETFSARKFFGVSNPLDEDTIQGNQTNSPSNEAFFDVFVHETNSLAIPTVRFIATIQFVSHFTERKNLTIS